MDAPNILWITLDSVRADHTSIYGYERDTTPYLAALKEDGVAFRQCFAHSRATKPSSGAILTGTPPTHNTLGITGDALPETVPTVAERFSDIGYRTACFSRNTYVSSATCLDRGFDRFQWLSSATLHQLHPTTVLRYLWNIRQHSAGLSLDTAKHSSAFLVNETAKRWLDQFGTEDEPFFFYIHYNEPHRPYYPPLGYRDRFDDDIGIPTDEAAEFALQTHYDLLDVIADGCDLTEADREALIGMYDTEIAYTDLMVGRLLEYVRSLNVGETIIVVTADHGELFGELGLLGHRHVVHPAVTHVPLVVCGLDDMAAGPEDLVQHVDVIHTLLARAGADVDGIAGVDLRNERRAFAVSQAAPNDFDYLLERNPEFETSSFHESTLTALRTDRFCYQRSEDGAELYERPNETEDVRDQYPEVAAELDQMLTSWMDEHGEPVGDGRHREFSTSKERQLRELGYLE
jgi:uncharacterized sulfatase